LSIKSRKLFAMIAITAMILTLLPMTALAASTNKVDKVPQVADGYEFTSDPPKLIIQDKDYHFCTVTGESFRLKLENAEWLAGTDEKWMSDPEISWANILSKKEAEVTIIGDSGATFEFPLYTKVTGEGEATVTIDARDSRVSGGTYTFAVSAAGKTIVKIDPVKKFAREITLGTIEIDETRIGAMGSQQNQRIKIKLPPKFEWVMEEGVSLDPDEVSFSGGFTDESTIKVDKVDGRTLELLFTPDPLEGRTARGSIFLKTLTIRAHRDAPYGEVVADFDGAVTSQELVVANYLSYGIEAEVKEVKEIVAGRYKNMTAKITVKENIPGSMIAGRELTVLLPEWVKINNVDKLKGFGFKYDADEDEDAYDDLEYATNKNEIYFVIPSCIDNTVNSRYEFELELSVQADKSGDIVAEFFGAGKEKQELVIATAIAPVTAEVAVSDLKIGVQDQPAPDIIITETKKGMIDDGSIYSANVDEDASKPPYYELAATGGSKLTVSLPKNFEWAGVPTVEVTEGNLEIGKSSVDGNALNIPIKSSSTKPSTIKITDVKVTLDRTVPEGPFDATIGGNAIVKNFNKDIDAVLSTPVLFAKSSVVKFHFADVITPAPGEIRATTTFTIGSTTYTVVEAGVAVEKTMDVAPYIKDGRTYLPVRFVAEALGVSADNIIWDPVNATVTIFKGDRIAQMTIGSNILLVNGVQLTMDAAPEIVSGRTMLPVRWMAQALGATIEWDPETQQVTVTQ